MKRISKPVWISPAAAEAIQELATRNNCSFDAMLSRVVEWQLAFDELRDTRDRREISQCVAR